MTKKKEIKEDKVVTVKSTVKLVNYTIRAVIPTGAYANIQPEITVEAKSLEEAEAYVIPHINKLFVEFLNKSERRTVTPKVEVQDKSVTGTTPTGTVISVPPGTPLHTPAYEKAKSAVVNAMSIDALEVIKGQISVSVKLTDTEKKSLLESVLPRRETELTK